MQQDQDIYRQCSNCKHRKRIQTSNPYECIPCDSCEQDYPTNFEEEWICILQQNNI